MPIEPPSAEEIDRVRGLAEGEPGTIKHRVRLAGLLRRAGDDVGAAAAFRQAGRAYAAQGDWPQALALARAMLHIDPSDRETQHYITSLYAKRERRTGGGGREAGDAASLSSVLEGPTPPALSNHERFPLATSRVAELKTLPPLRDLGPRDLFNTAHLLRTVTVQRGEVIFREGEASEGMFVILRGGADVTVVDDAGRRTSLTTLQSGDMFGEFSMFGPALRTAVVVATARTELLDIDRDLFELLTELSAVFRREVTASIRRRQKENVVARASLLSGLESSVRTEFAAQFDLQTVLPGELVVCQGEPTDRACLLGHGRLEIYDRDETGEKMYLADLLPGQFLPDPAVIDGEPASLCARAVEAGVVFWVPRQLLLKHAQSVPGGVRNLHRVFSEPPLASGAFAAVHSQPLADADPDRR